MACGVKGPCAFWGRGGCGLGGRGSGPGWCPLGGRQLEVARGYLRLLGRWMGRCRGLRQAPLLLSCGGFPLAHPADGEAEAGPAVEAVVPLREPLESNIFAMLSGTCSLPGAYCQAVCFAQSLPLTGGLVVCRERCCAVPGVGGQVLVASPAAHGTFAVHRHWVRMRLSRFANAVRRSSEPWGGSGRWARGGCDRLLAGVAPSGLCTCR